MLTDLPFLSEMKISNIEFYKQLSVEIDKWADENKDAKNYWKIYLINAPKIFYFLKNLVQLENLTKKEKALITAAIAYFINPFDLLPEMILGALGFLDDVVASAFVINKLMGNISEKFITQNWNGSLNFGAFIKNILTNADHIVEEQIHKKLKKEFDSVK